MEDQDQTNYSTVLVGMLEKRRKSTSRRNQKKRDHGFVFIWNRKKHVEIILLAKAFFLLIDHRKGTVVVDSCS